MNLILNFTAWIKDNNVTPVIIYINNIYKYSKYGKVSRGLSN